MGPLSRPMPRRGRAPPGDGSDSAIASQVVQSAIADTLIPSPLSSTDYPYQAGYATADYEANQ